MEIKYNKKYILYLLNMILGYFMNVSEVGGYIVLDRFLFFYVYVN